MFKSLISRVLYDLGFRLVGYLNGREGQFGNWIQSWLENGYHADMVWLEKHLSIRANPISIEPYGKTIVVAAFPYYTKSPEEWGEKNPISNYAWGKDYHKVIKKKLFQAINILKEHIPDFQGRAFVDSAPLPEKIIASQAGIGWIGKNSLLINLKLGSYLFLGEIVCNLDLPSTMPETDHCGTCTRCIDACPTDAILTDKIIDSNRCISWATIEKKGEFTDSETRMLDYQIFGCDICQQVCPWNHQLVPDIKSPFSCDSKWLGMKMEDFAELSLEQFNHLKRNSPVKRAKFFGIKRNAKAILKHRESE